MTEEEKATYFADVRDWTENVYPRLLAHVEAWEEADVKDFDTGLMLASALQKARSFVSVANTFSHNRALRVLYNSLETIKRYDRGPKDIVNNRTGESIKSYRHVAAVPVTKEDEDGVTTTTDAEQSFRKASEEVAKRFGGKRPNHYDEWKHLMSAGLRNEIENLQTYYLELAAASQLSNNLDDNPKATQADRAAANQRVLMWDDKINAIHAAAEKEWAVLNGTESAQVEEKVTSKKRGRKSKTSDE